MAGYPGTLVAYYYVLCTEYCGITAHNGVYHRIYAAYRDNTNCKFGTDLCPRGSQLRNPTQGQLQQGFAEKAPGKRPSKFIPTNLQRSSRFSSPSSGSFQSQRCIVPPRAANPFVCRDRETVSSLSHRTIRREITSDHTHASHVSACVATTIVCRRSLSHVSSISQSSLALLIDV